MADRSEGAPHKGRAGKAQKDRDVVVQGPSSLRIAVAKSRSGAPEY